MTAQYTTERTGKIGKSGNTSPEPGRGPSRVACSNVRARKCFTLVELLVVIAVVSVILSLAQPWLHNARELSALTQCLSNHHQIMMAKAMYAHDYDGLNYYAAKRLVNGQNHYFTQVRNAQDPLPMLRGILFITDRIWDIHGPALQHGVLVTEGYLSTPESLWCASPGPTFFHESGQSIGPVLSHHPTYGARSFGQPGLIAGYGTYLTREVFLADTVMLDDNRDRALSFCPFSLQSLPQTH